MCETVVATKGNSSRCWNISTYFPTTLASSSLVDYLQVIICRFKNLVASDQALKLRHPLWFGIAQYSTRIVLSH
jgi:hypothetical protein